MRRLAYLTDILESDDHAIALRVNQRRQKKRSSEEIHGAKIQFRGSRSGSGTRSVWRRREREKRIIIEVRVAGQQVGGDTLQGIDN